MSEMRFRVEDMSCGHCVASISGAVGRLTGVTSVEASLETKMVTVMSDGELDGNGVMAAIQAAGFIPQPAE
jgi:copper chaperone